MTDKEIRRMKDRVISIFEKFNILDHAVTIDSLIDYILRLIDSMQERPGLKFKVGDKVRNDKIAGLPICTIESIDDTTYYCDYTNFDIIVQDKWELVVWPKDCMYSKGNYTDEDRKVLCDGCEEECRFNKKEEPVSEDLDKEIDNAHKLFDEEVGWNSDEGARAYVADWFAHYFANWQKQQMMAKAVDTTVHIDAGGYPYIPQMELYDYEKDIPLAKEGDKYKVILIKEE